ncbi:NAD-dependent epimerase/dehydratase family protein [Curtobacterium ammoniigenes]|uniref:NAD-dependent epimerase/dehydratase family protein n=1 Tax=Curtobacterium ammoniigenes TaxID=395387 RepID=UPI00082D11B8|nr:NAD(P)-dependent oxidoreductase [Curtobacterium ammoniigenes]
MSRVIVTGSAGRLGRSVVTVLRDCGHEVIGVDREADPGDPASRGADLTDARAASWLFSEVRPEAVIHLAAIAVPFSAPEDVILRTNTALAFAVMQAAVDAGARTVITASSPTVFGYGSPAGWTPRRLPLDESMEPEPWNAYALSKLVAERTARMFAAQLGNQVRFASFRPCYVIAPEEWHGALTQQGHTVLERLDRPELAAPALFNYVDARDAGMFLHVLMSGIRDIPNGETFLVGAADALARRPLAELIPDYLPQLTGVAADLTGSRPAFSIAKAQRLLGWHPTRSWRSELGVDAEPVLTRGAE